MTQYRLVLQQRSPGLAGSGLLRLNNPTGSRRVLYTPLVPERDHYRLVALGEHPRTQSLRAVRSLPLGRRRPGPRRRIKGVGGTNHRRYTVVYGSRGGFPQHNHHGRVERDETNAPIPILWDPEAIPRRRRGRGGRVTRRIEEEEEEEEEEDQLGRESLNTWASEQTFPTKQTDTCGYLRLSVKGSILDQGPSSR
jgi:hypothetical protein